MQMTMLGGRRSSSAQLPRHLICSTGDRRQLEWLPLQQLRSRMPVHADDMAADEQVWPTGQPC